MSPPNTTHDYKALMARALRELDSAQARIRILEATASEPIAVVGMACRFPGQADTPERFWDLLMAGRCTVQEIPSDRWAWRDWYDPTPDTPGKMYTRFGHFLDHVDAFDPGFFNLSPREAIEMDPQQRLLMECAWESLLSSGLNPGARPPDAVGVYVGMMNQDYSRLYTQPDRIDRHTGTGNAPSMAAGRLAHFFGFHGPVLTLDTACSSSLVATHLACQALRHKECDRMLVGGVNLILSPLPMIAECRTRMLASDGLCKTFDAAADGFGRGEGCGMIVLERLSDAVAHGRSILALIRGTAINHDGHSSGLTVPNPQAQSAVIRQALKDAGLASDAVDYIEAHGTGTELGDPVEVRALQSVFGEGRSPGRPVWVGSVKTNMGHLEGAAGIVALMKTVLAVNRAKIPPHLHLRHPNRHIDWEHLALRVPTQSLAWPDVSGRARVAGVSSFGFSGTNAHLVLSSGPAAGSEVRPAPPAPAFQRERYWIETPAPLSVAEPALGPAPAKAADSDSSFAYTVNWELVGNQSPGAASGGCPPFALESVGATFAALLDEDRRSALHRYAGVLKELDAAATAYVCRALLELGFCFEVGRTYALDRMPCCLGIVPEHIPLLNHLVRVMAGDGILRLENGQLTVLKDVAFRARPDVAAILRRCPEAAAECGLLARCGERLAQALAGKANVLELLFPGGDMAEAEQLYQHSIGAQFMNEAVRCVFATVLDSVPVRRPLTVLEVGAGTGGTTASILPALASRQVQYTFSDISTLLIARARERFKTWPWMDYQVLNIEAPPKTTARYDIVLAANAIHATHNLEQSAAHIFRLLKPGGLLILLESTAALRWIDLTFGLTDGWWRFTDTQVRPHHPLIDGEAWKQLLIHQGFDSVQALPQAKDREGALKYQGLLVARKPATASAAASSMAQAVVDVAPASAMRQARPRMLMFHQNLEWEQRLLRRFELQQEGCVQIRTGARFERISDRLYAVNPRRASDVVALLDALEQDFGRCPLDCVYAWGIGPAGLSTDPRVQEDRMLSVVIGLSHLINAAQAGRRPCRINVLTQEAVPVGQPVSESGALQGTLWGLCRTASVEVPDHWGALVDLGPVVEDRDLDALLKVWDSEGGEDFAAIRDGACWVPCIRRAAAGAVPRISTPAWYLIVGGLGQLGLEWAEALIRYGARHLCLVGRHAPGAASLGRIAAWRQQGIDVRVASADVADESGLAAVMQSMASLGLPLKGVVHAAAVSGYHALNAITEAEWSASWQAKVRGTRLLDCLVRGQPLDFLVYVSSISAVWGAEKQAAYVSACAFQDAWAHYQQPRGIPALSINLGPVSGGLLPASATEALERVGIHTFDPAVAIEAMSAILSKTGQALIVDMDWARFGELYSARRRRLFLNAVANLGKAPKVAPVASGSPKHLATIPLAERLPLIRDYVAGLLAEIMKLPAPSIDGARPLTEVGMDSLLAVDIRNRIEKDWALDLPLSSFLDGSSLNDLADALLVKLNPVQSPAAEPGHLPGAGVPPLRPGSENKAGRGCPSSPSEVLGTKRDEGVPVPNAKFDERSGTRVSRLQERGVGNDAGQCRSDSPGVFEPIPLSVGQRALWFLHTLDPKSSAYHIAHAQILGRDWSEPALRTAWRRVIQRHALLHAVIEVAPEGPRFTPLRCLDDGIAVVKARDWTAERLRPWLDEYADRPFDLAREPVWRAVLLREAPVDEGPASERRDVFVLAVHHIAVDFRSLQTLMSELALAYQAARAGQADTLNPLASDFDAFVSWERHQVKGPEGERHWQFWRARLAPPLSVLRLPTDRPRPPVQTYRGTQLSFVLDPDRVEGAKRLSARAGVTPYIVFLAAYALALRRCTGQDELVLGSPMDLRLKSAFEPVVGYFVNPIVLRLNLAGNPGVVDWVRRVRQVVLEAMDHLAYPFPLLVERLNPPRDPSRSPLFQADFVWDQARTADPAMDAGAGPALFERILSSEQRGADFDLMLTLVDAGGPLRGNWRYNADLFERATLDTLHEYFEVALQAMAAQPDTLIDDLPLWVRSERERLAALS